MTPFPETPANPDEGPERETFRADRADTCEDTPRGDQTEMPPEPDIEAQADHGTKSAEPYPEGCAHREGVDEELRRGDLGEDLSRGPDLRDIETRASIFDSSSLMEKACAEADPELWERWAGEFYDRYRPPLYRTLRQRGLSKLDADELSHEIVYQLLKSIRKGYGPGGGMQGGFRYDPVKGGFRRYLFRMLSHELAKFWGRLPKGGKRALGQKVKLEFGTRVLDFYQQVGSASPPDVEWLPDAPPEVTRDLNGWIECMITAIQEEMPHLSRPEFLLVARERIGQEGWDVREEFRKTANGRSADARGIPLAQFVAEDRGLRSETAEWIVYAVERLCRQESRKLREGGLPIDGLDELAIALLVAPEQPRVEAPDRSMVECLAAQCSVNPEHMADYVNYVLELSTPEEIACQRGIKTNTIYRRFQRIRDKIQRSRDS